MMSVSMVFLSTNAYFSIDSVSRDLQEELIETVRCAVSLPLRIEIKDIFDQTSTELLVTAFLDSGGRGRPRVTYDVTTALNQLGNCHKPGTQTTPQRPLQSQNMFLCMPFTFSRQDI